MKVYRIDVIHPLSSRLKNSVIIGFYPGGLNGRALSVFGNFFKIDLKMLH